MCTAIRFRAKGVYYGRTLDLEYSLGEGVIFTPRRYPMIMRHADGTDDHLALLGIGIMRDGYPLYYDAMNERGLWMAGLNFPRYCRYGDCVQGALNLASFELIPYVLSRCGTVSDAIDLLKRANITSEEFSEGLPASPLHFMICDRDGSIVIEQTSRGLSIFDNAAGVLTNSPPFDHQTENLAKYLNLTPDTPRSRFSDRLTLDPCSRGMGAFGLPGDVSSTSRFVRAAFTLANASKPEDTDACISQFYHVLGSVEQVSGTVRLDGGALERTVYTSCADAQKMTYYYTTYENPTPTAVRMSRETLDSALPVCYPLDRNMLVIKQN